MKIHERFDCTQLCSQRDQWLDENRSARGCGRIDLDPVDQRTEPKAIHSGGFMGRLPIAPDSASLDGVKRNPRYPTEDPDDGCPGAWYRSAFVSSVLPYLRRRDDHGGRVVNLMLDRTDDELLVELVSYAEDEQERWEAYRAQESARG